MTNEQYATFLMCGWGLCIKDVRSQGGGCQSDMGEGVFRCGPPNS